MKESRTVILKVLLVALALYCFLLSIGLMGAAFKGFGEGFAKSLISTTSNPFIGLFIGILATSIVQSSSTTTSMVVGIVGSGVLDVANAIPIIMGANIGTTVTNMLVSLGHIGRREEFKRAISGASVHDFFNLICVIILFPLELATGFLEKCATALAGAFQSVGGITLTSPIKVITKPVVHGIYEVLRSISGGSNIAGCVGMLILSVVILFFSLYFIVKLMRSLVAGRAEIVLNNVISRRGYLGLLAGLIFTIMVQSSSITTSLLIPMVAAGILTVESIFPITMGANIGTTTTAILASFASGNVSAITIAFVHFLFNCFGVLVLYPIPIFRAIPIRCAHALGNLAYRKRGYAVLYVLGVFFVLPTILIIVYNIAV